MQQLTSNTKELVSKITSKGQITIPIEIRRHLGLHAKDKITFVIEPEGSVRIKAPRYTTISSLAGAAGPLPTPLPWKKVRKLAREEHLKKYETDK